MHSDKCHHTYALQNMADTSKDRLLLGGGICHITAMLQYHVCSKQVSA